MKLKKLITFFIPKLFICLIILGIILAPKSAIKAAKDGISIWINILMPSLLPFINRCKFNSFIKNRRHIRYFNQSSNSKDF